MFWRIQCKLWKKILNAALQAIIWVKDFAVVICYPGWILIDRSGKHFGTILNFLRDGKAILPHSRHDLEELHAEAKYYLVSELVDKCQKALKLKKDEHFPVCRIPVITSPREAKLLIAKTRKVHSIFLLQISCKFVKHVYMLFRLRFSLCWNKISCFYWNNLKYDLKFVLYTVSAIKEMKLNCFEVLAQRKPIKEQCFPLLDTGNSQVLQIMWYRLCVCCAFQVSSVVSCVGLHTVDLCEGWYFFFQARWQLGNLEKCINMYCKSL